MIIKLFRRGTGRGSGPVDYLLSETDAGGQPRAHKPDVVSGDPELTRRVIDSLDFRHKYTSGVLSFAMEDRPTKAQQEQVIQEFEDLAFAGLTRDRVTIFWVRHTGEDGRIELHFVIPKVDLATGKQFNAFPPGWQRDFKDWKNLTNLKYGWADPEDPKRARVRSPGEREEKSRIAEKDSITDRLIERIRSEAVRDRIGVIEELKSMGYEIGRIQEEYVSVRRPEGQPLRLKGGIFSNVFSIEQSEKARMKDRAQRLGQSARGAALARGRREKLVQLRFEKKGLSEAREVTNG